jgi:hypothetical protein
MAGSQILIPASQLDAQRLGYQACSLTHFADLLEPEIAAGSKVEIGGALFQFTLDESIGGWGGIANDSDVYIKLTVAGAAVTASFTIVAPTWDTAKQGWYDGAERYIGGLYKDATGNYAIKWLYSPLDIWECLARGATRPIRRKIIEIGDWNMDATDFVQFAHGLILSKIRTIEALIRADGDTLRLMLFLAHIDGSLGGVATADATNIMLGRATGGYFDDVQFDAVAFNRGWVTIEYEA